MNILLFLGGNNIELNTIETGMTKQLQRMATIPDIEDEMENMEGIAIIECSMKQEIISPWILKYNNIVDSVC